MFRKLKTTKKSMRKREMDVNVDEDSSVQQQIQRTQKKQKLLSSMPMVTGSTQSGTQTKRQEPGNGSSPRDLSVLEKKHHEAMEEYIQTHLHVDDGNEGTPNAPDSGTSEDRAADNETELYQELIRTVQKSNVISEDHNDDTGTVLVGGTGLAEVILPTRSNNARPVNSRKGNSHSSSSSSALPLAKNNSSTTTTINMKPSIRSMIRKPNHVSEKKTDDLPSINPTSNETDSTRVGFDSFRDRPAAGPSSGKIMNRNRHDRAFATFVQRQRDRR